jgi:hypothetical protein
MDQGQMDYPIEAEFSGDDLLMENSGSNDDIVPLWENPLSASADQFVDLAEETSEAKVIPL